jgi:hypothetical protein
MKKSLWFIFVALLLADGTLYGDDYAEWQPITAGDWHVTTNWADVTNAPLPSPGYPMTKYSVWIGDGSVTISSQDVTIATLQLKSASILTVTNG